MASHPTRYLFPILVFSVSMGYFASAHRYYLPSRLMITGDFRECGDLYLGWDSGGGFHPEEKVSVLDMEEGGLSKRHTLEIRAVSGGNPAAGRGDVLLKAIVFNRLWFNVFQFARSGATQMEQEGSVRMGPGGAVEHTGVFTTAMMVFATGPQYGVARILIDGRERKTVDLRAPRDGKRDEVLRCREDYARYAKSIPLPPVRIRALRLESTGRFRLFSAFLVSARGAVSLVRDDTFLGVRPGWERSTEIGNIRAGSAVMNPVLLTFQALLALALALCAHGLIRFPERVRQRGGASLFHALFIQDRLWIFWSFFAGSSGVFSLWLLGQWPGWVSWDSLYCWNQTMTLQFSQDHPYVYSMYLLALRQIWDNPAAVALFQIAATSALGSALFYFCITRGPRWGILAVAPFFLAFIVSIPVGVYTTSLWKDIPFALLAVFWAFYLFYALYRRHAGAPIRYRGATVPLLSILFVLVCMMRHNGIINIVVIPACILAARLMPARAFVRWALLSGALLLLLMAAVPRALHIYDGYDPRIQVYSSISRPLAALFANNWYYSDDYAGDRKIVEKWMSVDEIRNRYDPAHDSFSGSVAQRFLSLPDRDKDRLIAMFRARLLPNLPLFMAARVPMFFTVLGFGESLCLNDNMLKNPPPDGFWDNPKVAFICPFAFAPKLKTLSRMQQHLLETTTVYNGLHGGIFIYWNLFFPLLLISVVGMLYKWLPASALASFFILAQVAFLFLILNEAEFRYFYFLYLFAFFIVPMALCEAISGTHARRVPPPRAK